jgi:hypothetical protein
MPRFRCEFVIETDNAENAWTVGCERLGYDEDYGFDYTIGSYSIEQDEAPVTPTEYNGSMTTINYDTAKFLRDLIKEIQENNKEVRRADGRGFTVPGHVIELTPATLLMLRTDLDDAVDGATA